MKIKKLLVTLAISGTILPAMAEFITKPDDNTLWLEDGKNIQTSSETAGKAWFNQNLKITSLHDGKGFSFECTEKDTRKNHSTFRRVPCSPEYPWLTFTVSSIEMHPGYRSWCFITSNPRTKTGHTNNPQKGIFSINCYEGAKIKENPKIMDIFFYLYTLKMNFSEIKMVKKPDYYIEATSPAFSSKKELNPGDTVKFTMYLKDSAEDVSLRLLYTDGLYSIKLNDKAKLQLKPEDKEQKVWSTEIKIKTLGPTRKKSSFSRGKIMLKGIILGGAINDPVWGMINYPYVAKAN